MYYIGLFENGRFCTLVGGEILTLADAVAQLKSASAPLKAEEVKGFLGYKFDRNGTSCALAVLDRFGAPIYNYDTEEL